MRWFPRSVMPKRPPFVVAGAEPADLRVAMEARHFEDGLTLSASPIWQVAPLTKAGRAAILRTAGETVRACLVEGWHVRRPGEKDASALVLKLTEHFMHGRLVSAAPERAALRYTDRLLVVTPRLVFSVQGSDPGQAFGRLADFYIGTRRAPRRRARPLPEGDAEALGWLQAEPPRSPDASPIQE